MASFNGRTALVTGGSSGIGRATCLAFADRGARVAVAEAVVLQVNEGGARHDVRQLVQSAARRPRAVAPRPAPGHGR